MTERQPDDDGGGGLARSCRLLSRGGVDAGAAPTVVTFRPKRDYADAQREVGISPLEDQVAAMRATIAEHEAKARRLDELLGSYSVEEREAAARFAEKQRARNGEKAAAFDAIATAHADEVSRVRAAIIARHRAFLEAFAAAGLGAQHVPMLIELLFGTDVDARDAPAIFAACLPDHPAPRRDPAADYEGERERQLNASGLIRPRSASVARDGGAKC